MYEKPLATGPSEYRWDVKENSVGSWYLLVTDPRDGEIIIQIAWPRPKIYMEECKALLNLYLDSFCKGRVRGMAKKAQEIRVALGLEEDI